MNVQVTHAKMEQHAKMETMRTLVFVLLDLMEQTVK